MEENKYKTITEEKTTKEMLKQEIDVLVEEKKKLETKFLKIKIELKKKKRAARLLE